MRGLTVKMLQAGLRLFSAKLARLHPEREEPYRVVRVANELDCACILDVGANTGQFALEIFRHGWTGQLISFEPLSHEYLTLTAAAAGKPRWLVAPRGALGDRVGKAEIIRAGNSASSSLLPMRNEHIEAAKHTAPIGTESIDIMRLDGVKSVPSTGSLFLKIDAQGYEMPVIRGASAIMPRIKGILAEVSFAQLYEGQELAFEVIEGLVRAGFRMHDLAPGFYHPVTGRMLQANVIMIR